jgi:hypothetical protein
MNQNDKKIRILREIREDEDRFLLIMRSIKYGTIDKVEIREGTIKRFRLSYDINLDDLDDVKKKFDELKSIPLLDE